MLRQTILTTILTILAVLLVGYDVASAARASRIELRDGTVLEDVVYRLDNTLKIVIMRMSNTKKSVDFADVCRILDKEGKDITASCLGARYRPPATQDSEQTCFQTTPEDESRKKLPFALVFRGGINVRHTSDAWYEGNTSSMDFGGDLVIAVSRKMALRLTISKAGTSYDSRELLTGVNVIKTDLLSHVWRYFFSVQAYDWPRWREDGRSMHYGYIGAGAVRHSLTGTALTINNEGGVGVYSASGRSQSRFAATGGCGLVQMVAPKIGFEVGAVLDVVFVGEDNYTYVSSGSPEVRAFLFGLRVGLVLMVR